METLSNIAVAGICITGVLFTIGLIRPGFVIWWSKSNSRKNVIMVWGTLLVSFSVIFFVVSSQKNDSFKEGNTSELDHKGSHK